MILKFALLGKKLIFSLQMFSFAGISLQTFVSFQQTKPK